MTVEVRITHDSRERGKAGLVYAEVYFDGVFGWQIVCEGAADEDMEQRFAARAPELEAQRQLELDEIHRARVRTSATGKVHGYLKNADAQIIAAIGLTPEEAVAMAEAVAVEAAASDAEAISGD